MASVARAGSRLSALVVPAIEQRHVGVPDPPTDGSDPVEWKLSNGATLRGWQAGRVAWIVVRGIATYRFEQSGAVAVQTDGGSEEESHDLWVRTVLPLVVQARGTQVIHASGLVGQHGIVGLCGRSNSGKSTLAAALSQRGRDVVADDSLAFVVADEEVTAVPLPYQLRLRPAAQARLGLPSTARRGAAMPSAPLAKLLLLDPVADPRGEPQVTEVSPAEAFAALLQHASWFRVFDQSERDLVDDYLALVGIVPVLRFAYPQELDRLEQTVDTLEELLGA